ncbi:MAG: tRNA uridine-5-carboxymethylaminomethyl(34) synthesis GTPase MnmE, partial [Oceanisphaera sp.]|nr:tRNA uridine-5-carboxymethylaminomethyl(34) synthesis GTPase MnmE [Oceanisphaera sp.]
QALSIAAEHLERGRRQLEEAGAGELLAEDLRLCHDALGDITGKMSSDALLGEIFSSFCIGK